MRTIGKGWMRASGGVVTGMVSLATLDRPSAAVTLSRTTWAPGVVNDVVITGFPTLNGPLLVRAHANVVIGLSASAELDTSDTVSPVLGFDGNHANDAVGGGCPEAPEDADGVTVKVTAALFPVLPAESRC
jgi:hypothetical protein